MKSQERHELETNSLAKLLVKWGEKIGPYSSHIVFGVIALVAALAIWRLSASAWSGRGSEGWDRIATTLVENRPDVERLKAAGEEHEGSVEGELAKILVADTEFYIAANNFLANKDEAMKKLASAKEIYEQLAKGATESVLRERAKLGKARVLEMEGNISEAIKAYGDVGGIYQDSAESRAKLLTEANAEKYGKWLRQAQGTIPRRPMGLGGPLDFGADPLGLPPEQGPETGPATGPAFGDDLMKEFNALQDRLPDAPGPDRYEGTPGEEGADPAASPDDATGSPDTTPPATEESPATPATDAPAAETPAAAPETPATGDEETPQP